MYRILSQMIKKKIKQADKIIFPGQGHFAQAIAKLKSKDMVSFIQDIVSDGKVFGHMSWLQVLLRIRRGTRG